jgi:hypothetical protein
VELYISAVMTETQYGASFHLLSVIPAKAGISPFPHEIPDNFLGTQNFRNDGHFFVPKQMEVSLEKQHFI